MYMRGLSLSLYLEDLCFLPFGKPFQISVPLLFFLLEVKFIEEVSCGCAFFHH